MEAQKDCLVRAISKDGFVNAVAVYTRGLTERARQIHHTSPVATAALGRALAACSMMGNALKDNGASVTMQIKGDGPLGTILTVSDSEGNVRGYVQNPAVDLALREDGKLDGLEDQLTELTKSDSWLFSSGASDTGMSTMSTGGEHGQGGTATGDGVEAAFNKLNPWHKSET